MKEIKFKNLQISLSRNALHIWYRRLTIELGIFGDDECPLFSFKIFNYLKSIRMFQIIGFQVFNFQFSLHLDI